MTGRSTIKLYLAEVAEPKYPKHRKLNVDFPNSMVHDLLP